MEDKKPTPITEQELIAMYKSMKPKRKRLAPGSKRRMTRDNSRR
jgi:hypothetical protein